MIGDLLLGNNNIKNVNSLTADSYVSSQNAYFQNVRSQSIYNSGDIYTDSLNAATVFAGVVNTNVVNADNPNKDTIFGTNDRDTANGDLYSGNLTANQNITAKESVQGSVFYPSSEVSQDAPCALIGAIAKNVDGKIFSCQKPGLWKGNGGGLEPGRIIMRGCYGGYKGGAYVCYPTCPAGTTMISRITGWSAYDTYLGLALCDTQG